MSESFQSKLPRKPRVHIEYEVHTGGATQKKELPFVLGIIADLTGARKEGFIDYSERHFINLDTDTINDILCAMEPMVVIPIRLKEEEMEITIEFKHIKDFSPINIIKNVPILNEIFIQRSKLNELQIRISNNKKLKEKISNGLNGDSNSIIADLNFFDQKQKDYTKSLIDNFLFILKESKLTDKDITELIQKMILNIDKEFQSILDSILHNKNFQRLEGSWNGIFHILRNLPINQQFKIKVLNANIQELKQDLNDAIDFDQSQLFKWLYESEYGTYGGTPYTTLLIDYYIEKVQEDFQFLIKISQIAACAHMPTVLSIGPSIFDVDSIEKIYNINNISKIFESSDMISFSNFRETDDARYVAFVCPRFMGRIPYGKDNPVLEINYTEKIENHDSFSWTNAGYAYVERIGQSFLETNWFSSIIGPENGGKVENLPVYTYRAKNGELKLKCPTEIAITDRKEAELSRNGIISLCHHSNSNYAAFFSGQSLNKPSRYTTVEANMNAELSSRFQCILITSRFAHYIKCMIRDQIGSFTDKNELKIYLNNWIMGYVLLNENAPNDIKARFPLKNALVEVIEDPSSPGKYKTIIFIQPHFQLDELTVFLRLVGTIPGGS